MINNNNDNSSLLCPTWKYGTGPMSVETLGRGGSCLINLERNIKSIRGSCLSTTPCGAHTSILLSWNF